MATRGWESITARDVATRAGTAPASLDRGQRQGAKRCWVTPDRALHPYLAGAPKPEGAWFFQSLTEARRWIALLTLQEHGHIRHLQRQTPFPLSVHGVVLGRYLADATYDEWRDGAWQPVVEDTKPRTGFRQDLYQWKRKHVRAQYGITIREV
jgi:hypothetical protein